MKYHVANAIAKLGVVNRRGLRSWFREPRHSALGRRERPQMSTVNWDRSRRSRAACATSRKRKRGTARRSDCATSYTFGSLAFFDCGGTRLMLSAQEKPRLSPILYLRVEDIRAAYELLRSRGVEFGEAPHMIHRHADGTEEWMAHFNDPEGRTLAILSQVKP